MDPMDVMAQFVADLSKNIAVLTAENVSLKREIVRLTAQVSSANAADINHATAQGTVAN